MTRRLPSLHPTQPEANTVPAPAVQHGKNARPWMQPHRALNQPTGSKTCRPGQGGPGKPQGEPRVCLDMRQTTWAGTNCWSASPVGTDMPGLLLIASQGIADTDERRSGAETLMGSWTALPVTEGFARASLRADRSATTTTLLGLALVLLGGRFVVTQPLEIGKNAGLGHLALEATQGGFDPFVLADGDLGHEEAAETVAARQCSKRPQLRPAGAAGLSGAGGSVAPAPC